MMKWTRINLSCWTLFVMKFWSLAIATSSMSYAGNPCQSEELAALGIYACLDPTVFKHRNITSLLDEFKANQTELYKQLQNVTNPTKEHFLEPLTDFECNTSPMLYSLRLYAYVGNSSMMRYEGNEALMTPLKPHNLWLNKNLYEKFKNMSISSKNLTMEELRFLNKTILSFTRQGLNLFERNITELRNLKKNIKELFTQYTHNIDSIVEYLNLTTEELAGVPDSYLKTLQNISYGYQVPVDHYAFTYINAYCDHEETRKIIFVKFFSRGNSSNTKLSKMLVNLRNQLAKGLGYSNYANYNTEIMMAETNDKVYGFLQNVGNTLKEFDDIDNREFLEAKRNRCATVKENCTDRVQMWDVDYLSNILRRTKYRFKRRTTFEYFPISHVLNKTLKIFEHLFSIRFEEKQNVKLWEGKVRLLILKDEDNNTLGNILLDLFRRPGKVRWQYALLLQPSCVTSLGRRQLPVASVVTYFETGNNETSDPLMSFYDVRILITKLGKAIQAALTKSHISQFSGFPEEVDFAEAQKEMFEYWLREPEIIKNITSHYKNGTSLPMYLFEALMKFERIGWSNKNLRNVVTALLENQASTKDGHVDLDELYRNDLKRYLNYTMPIDFNFTKTFTHLSSSEIGLNYMGLWSQVCSADMFYSKFKQYGIMNKTTGMEYRLKVLEKGSSEDAVDMFQAFLGRNLSTIPYSILNNPNNVTRL